GFWCVIAPSMQTTAAIIATIVALLLLFFLAYKRFVKPVSKKYVLPEPLKLILRDQIGFYRALDQAGMSVFENETAEFLARVNITGVDTTVEDIDRVLIAASAVIPLFAFPDFFYHDLMFVDVYKDVFNHDFETTGTNRRIMGMVGSGVMNGRMALSQRALRAGFSNETDKRNTAVHEFVHLLDKADGTIDGLPELLLDKHQTLPWLELIRQKMVDIRNHESDVDSYGGTSETEFFAVAAEYFFERPELFEQKHPKLYKLMSAAFRREPAVKGKNGSGIPDRNEPCFCGSGEKYKNCHGKNVM
ncbi:MAG: zinc-dependent peptidase, partial [Flavobacteriales bacterium]